MHKVNMRQLRDTKKLKSWLRSGHTVELRERNQPIARIVPVKGRRKAVKVPDFAAMRREIFGDRVFGSNIVIEEREKSRY